MKVEHSSSSWANINRCLISLHDNHRSLDSVFTINIGNGMSTWFWHDRWLNGSILRENFPRLYALETEKSCVVADRRFDISWNWKWRRMPRGGAEEAQLTLMLASLTQVALTDSQDHWICPGSPLSTYSVKFVRNPLVLNSNGLRKTY
ncbi:uncharacterized protein [Rutidosis leptorrhynchoides]|uniref:uncharacterized protein n=1 Tax=Rutidosis leptorrhynchoides TaxID=125765 RepID=UPI003A9A1C50